MNSKGGGETFSSKLKSGGIIFSRFLKYEGKDFFGFPERRGILFSESRLNLYLNLYSGESGI